MSFFIANQTLYFLYSCLLGAALSLLYDVFRIIRLLAKPVRIAVVIEDIIFFAAAAFATFIFFITFTEGMIRFYVIVGEFAGFVLCHLTIGAAAVHIMEKVIKAVKSALYKIFTPVFRFAGKSSKAVSGKLIDITKKTKNRIKNRKKHLKFVCNIRYNHSKCKDKPKDGAKMLKAIKKRRKKKTKSFVLMFVILAFAVYAVVSLATSYSKIASMNETIDNLRAEYAKEVETGKQYDYLLKEKNYKEYAEKAAREAGYVEPDERVFVDIAGR